MIHLIELSLPTKDAVDATMMFDPLVASDLDYCAKTWMANKPYLACRPWIAVTHGKGLRITGWRKDAVSCKKTTDQDSVVRSREISLTFGEQIALTGRLIPIRRSSNTQGSKVKTVRDAAAGREDPKAAYEAWTKERFIDIMAHATIDSLEVQDSHQRQVLRKSKCHNGQTHIRPEFIPVIDITVLLTIKNPAMIEKWLLNGTGPQKAFGYGAFLPTLDPRTGSAAAS